MDEGDASADNDRSSTAGDTAPIDWPQCVDEGCIGIQAPGKDRCLAHLGFGALYELLQAGLTEIDLRGVCVDSILMRRVTAALPLAGDNLRVADDCRFDHATFVDSVHFRHVRFMGSCSFRNITTHELLTFDYCAFKPQFAVMFSDCQLTQGISISNSHFAGRAFVSNSRIESTSASVKNSSFDDDFILLGLEGDYLFVEGCSGKRLSVQGCAHQLASLKSLEFGAIDAGALELGDSFLLTKCRAERVGLGVIDAKKQILIEECEFGGTENIGPLKAGEGVRVRRTTSTTRRNITCESDLVDLTDSRFVDGVTITASTERIALDETHYGRSSLIVGVARNDRLPRLLSVRRADVQNFSLDNLDLSDCAFTNTHNLDALRLRRAPFGLAPSGFRLRPFRAISKRRVLLEERLWRSRAGSRGLPAEEASEQAPAPDATEIGELYRSLRAGLERGRNEPGAADFYYGEMEMRRHGPDASRAEREILRAYWAFSGYGLRASRSLVALVFLTAVAALGFWRFGFQGGQPSSFWAALTYAAGAATLHPPARHLTTSGEALSICFRVIGPVLLGLAVFSIRGRVRR